MEESALERYFDKHIADVASHTEEEEEMNEEQGEDQFFKLLPDELLMLKDSSQDQKESIEDRSKDPELSAKGSEEWKSHSIPRSLDCTGQKLTPIIKNVTSSVNLGCRLDLDFIAANAWNVKFNRKRFGGLSMKIRNPRATGVFHSTGKLVCVGADSVEKAKVAARRLARIVQKLGFPVRFLKFEVHNLVASCKTNPISLERMAAYTGCSYEPELFPALFYNVMPGMNIIVYRSGTLALSGAKNEADIHKAFEVAQPIVNYFRK